MRSGEMGMTNISEFPNCQSFFSYWRTWLALLALHALIEPTGQGCFYGLDKTCMVSQSSCREREENQ